MMDARHELTAMKMKCLPYMCVVTRMGIWRNKEVRQLVGVREKMRDTVDFKVFKWLGHMDRMGGEPLTKRVYESDVQEKGVMAGFVRAG